MGIVASDLESVRATPRTWQQAMKLAVRNGAELCRRLDLPAEYAVAAARAERLFPVFAPLGYVAKMRQGDPTDPLLRQVLPLDAEFAEVAGFVTDPVGDLDAQHGPGTLQKYHGRVLLITTGACAIHCRYCFRRHFPYNDGPTAWQRWNEALDQIAADDSIDEVILSGGDPLTLGDESLGELAERLAMIPHVRRLRVHSRLPIVIPERVTDGLIGWLRGTRLAPIIVVHANHPREVDDTVIAAFDRLVDAGITVLNQSVLLRGVNDDLATLAGLCRALVNARVLPYYLHQLDRVAGAAHFEVPESRGIELLEQLRGLLPGYAVPRYVREVPGDVGKRGIT